MTMFRSLTDAQLAARHDLPSRNYTCTCTDEEMDARTSDVCPEFARPPVNPILVALREWEIEPWCALQTLNGYSFTYDHIDDWCDAWEPTTTPAEIEHARKVLTRLAALAEVTA